MKDKVIFVLVFVAILSIGLGVFLPICLNAHDKYEGQVVFSTEKEYSQFKQELLDSKARWSSPENKLEVLSSTPPIIVTFKIRVPQDYNFPYGDKSPMSRVCVGLQIFCIFAAIALAYLVPAYVYGKGPLWLFKYKETELG